MPEQGVRLAYQTNCCWAGLGRQIAALLKATAICHLQHPVRVEPDTRTSARLRPGQASSTRVARQTRMGKFD